MKPPAILVVEDNPVSRKMVRVALETDGYLVVEAPDGRAALTLFETAAPDLVLQDLLLPDMDGFELVRRLRALPRGDEVPIVALSGFLSGMEEAQVQTTGFSRGREGRPSQRHRQAGAQRLRDDPARRG